MNRDRMNAQGMLNHILRIAYLPVELNMLTLPSVAP